MDNQVNLIGNLGKDPETTYTQGGLAIAKFSLATFKKRPKQGSDEWETLTEWHNIVCFGKTAEYLKAVKGDLVHVIGEIHYSDWEKDGVKHFRTEINASKVQLLKKKADSVVVAQDVKTPEPADDDSLPF